MQVEELASFLQWLDQEVRKPNLVGLYQNLQNILNRNIQQGQPKQPFENQKTALIDAVLKVNLDELNDAQMRFADKIELLSLVGPNAKEIIEDILFKNSLDIATASQKIGQLHTSLTTLLQKMGQVSEGLGKYVEAAPPEYEEALVRIRFQGNVAIKNIVDLREWGDAWFEIGRGIALANKLPPEDIKVIGASRGSLVYDLAVAFVVANTLTGIILLVLKVADRVLDIRKKAEELRGMQLSNDKAALELDREADKIEKEGQAEVLASVKTSKKLDGEQATALTNAISKIFGFVSGGGEIDVHIKKEIVDEDGTKQGKPAEQKMIAEIKKSFNEIKRLEAKLLLLKGKSN